MGHGGTRMDVVVNYGDPAAYQRMNEASSKIARHREDAQRFLSDAQVYSSQGEMHYSLDTDDVHHFRLSGKPREE